MTLIVLLIHFIFVASSPFVMAIYEIDFHSFSFLIGASSAYLIIVFFETRKIKKNTKGYSQ